MRCGREAMERFKVTEATNLRLQGVIDERNTALAHMNLEMQASTSYLRRALKSLRVQYSGAVSLAQYEHFAEMLRETRLRAASATQAANIAATAKASSEDQCAALRLQYDSLQELLQSLKSGGNNSDNIVAWQQKLEKSRLAEMQVIPFYDNKLYPNSFPNVFLGCTRA